LIIERALAEAIDAAELLERGFVQGIARSEEGFENEETILPRLCVSSEALNRVTALCNKAINGGWITSKGLVDLEPAALRVAIRRP